MEVTTAPPTVTHSLEISGETTASVGETINLTAKYYTSTNGVSDGGVDVTDEATWSVSGAASVSDGAVTSSTAGTFLVEASYDGESGSKYVTLPRLLLLRRTSPGA